MDRILTGIFGGSFNPPHIGHLIVILDILQSLPFEKIYFVPTKIPPHKDASFLINEKHRLNMLNIALENIPNTRISTFETDNENISYSYLTINHFIKDLNIQPKDLFFILGIDAFMLIKTWKKYPEILKTCNFLILSRPMNTDPANIFGILKKTFEISPIEEYNYSNETGIYYTENIMLNISSSMIRNRIKNNKTIRFLIPPLIEEYIYHNKLYKKEK